MRLPRRKGPPLDAAAVARGLSALQGWTAPGGARIERTFRFPDFKSALGFANRVGALAEEADHHPEMAVAWGAVTVSLTTHSAKGLTENDFELARRIDALGVAGKETP